MSEVINWILNQNPLAVGVGVYLIMKMKAVETNLNNHIPTQLKALKDSIEQIAQRLNRLEDKFDRFIERQIK